MINAIYSDICTQEERGFKCHKFKEDVHNPEPQAVEQQILSATHPFLGIIFTGLPLNNLDGHLVNS
jgi:hypothetical protein